MEIPMKKQKLWECKIGECDAAKLPPGGDNPMRDAVAEKYKELTGEDPDFLFSGWGAELDEGERAAHENRMPDIDVQIEETEKHLAMLKRAKTSMEQDQ